MKNGTFSRRDFFKASLILSAGGCIGLEPSIKNPRETFPYDSFTDSGVHYVGRGQGDTTIVFVHGYGGRAENFAAQVNNLPDNFRRYAIDLKGFGKSEKPKRKYTLEESAKDLESFIRDMNISRAVLVGQSRGSSVVRKYAAANPEKAEAMVLCCAYIDGYTKINERLEESLSKQPIIGDLFVQLAKLIGGRDDVKKNLKNAVYYDTKVTDGMVEWCYEPISRKDGFESFFSAGRNLDLRITDKELSEIDKAKIPFVYLAGDHDDVIKPINWDYDRLVMLANTGHLISIDQPELLTDIIIKAVESKHYEPKKFADKIREYVNKS